MDVVLGSSVTSAVVMVVADVVFVAVVVWTGVVVTSVAADVAVDTADVLF